MRQIVGTRAEAEVAEQNHNCSPMLSGLSRSLTWAVSYLSVVVLISIAVSVASIVFSPCDDNLASDTSNRRLRRGRCESTSYPWLRAASLHNSLYTNAGLEKCFLRRYRAGPL